MLTNIQAMNAPNNNNKKEDNCLFLRVLDDLREDERFDVSIFLVGYFLLFFIFNTVGNKKAYSAKAESGTACQRIGLFGYKSFVVEPGAVCA